MCVCVCVCHCIQDHHKLKPAVINQACVGFKQAQRVKSVFKELSSEFTVELK